MREGAFKPHNTCKASPRLPSSGGCRSYLGSLQTFSLLMECGWAFQCCNRKERGAVSTGAEASSHQDIQQQHFNECYKNSNTN